MTAEGLGTTAATRLWRQRGKDALRSGPYHAALTNLAKETGDPAARKTFGAELLWQATNSRQLLSPLGRRR